MFKYSYKKLWIFLSENEKSKMDFQNEIGISSATLAKMNRNEKVSQGVIDRISEKYGIVREDICEFKSDIQIWLENIEAKIKYHHYTLYAGQWPDFVFELTNDQVLLWHNLEKNNEIERLVNAFEVMANFEHRINAGIINSTKTSLQGNLLTIKGSLAVVEKMITKLFL